MQFIIAGIVAAVVSWIGNRAGLKLMGARAIIVAAPLWEELAKSGAAIIAGAPLIWTHAAFGAIEGIYDAWGEGARGLEAAAASLFGHLFYGYITYLVWQKQGFFLAAVLSGYAVHMLWNLTVMKFMVSRRRKS